MTFLKNKFGVGRGNLFNRLSKARVVAVLAGIVFLMLLLVSFVLIRREALLESALANAKTKLLDEYQVEMHIESATFTGLRTVNFTGIELHQVGQSSFLDIGHLSVQVSIFPLLKKQVQPSWIDMDNVLISLIQRDSVSNYEFLLHRLSPFKSDTSDIEQEHSATPDVERNSFQTERVLDRLLGQVFDNVPSHMDLSNLQFDFVKDSLKQEVQIPHLSIRGGNLASEIYQDGSPAWQVTGQIRPSSRQFYTRIDRLRPELSLPFLDQHLDLHLSFSSFEFRLAKAERRQDQLRLQGESKVKELELHHWRISAENVHLSEGLLAFEVCAGPDYVELGNESQIMIKNLVLYPKLRIEQLKKPIFTFSLETSKIPAQELFDAFPAGLFKSLEGIRVSGELQYYMQGRFDTEQPDSVQFESAMQQHGFKINHWGNLNVSQLNSSFIYEPEVSGRKIIVGPENPDFMPLQAIPSHLKQAILTTEDPSFYYHNGFVMESIRESIATNYKEKAFKRGGSTISMQLAKNLFLNRNKTMVRKVEEVIIVWLIESNRALSKDRMFEIYLNVIEWGNGVYGIKEAARYYFGKHPTQLHIGESLYLTSIVPRPKTGLYAFEYTGRLRPHIEPYFNFVGNIMARRGFVELDSISSYGFGDVVLRKSLRPKSPWGEELIILPPPPLHFQYDPELQ